MGTIHNIIVSGCPIVTQRNMFPEELKVSTFIKQGRQLNMCEIFEAHQNITATFNTNVEPVGNVYLWKNDRYFAKNEILQQGELGKVYGVFITKKKRIHSNHKMPIFWRNEMLDVLDDVKKRLDLANAGQENSF